MSMIWWSDLLLLFKRPRAVADGRAGQVVVQPCKPVGVAPSWGSLVTLLLGD